MSTGLCRRCLNTKIREGRRIRTCGSCGEPLKAKGNSATCLVCYKALRKIKKRERVLRLSAERSARAVTFRQRQAAKMRAYWSDMRPIDRLARIATAKEHGFARGIQDPAMRSQIARKRNAIQMARLQAWYMTPIGQMARAMQRQAKEEKARRHRKRRREKYGKRRDHYPSAFNKPLKLKIRARDGFRCRICGALEGDVPWQVHHINFDRADQRPANLITLCNRCHGKTNVDRHRWQAICEHQMTRPMRRP